MNQRTFSFGWSIVLPALGLLAGCSGESTTATTTTETTTTETTTGTTTTSGDAPPCGDPVMSGPTITVDASADGDALRSLQGFLNGIDPAPGNTATFDEAMVTELHPAF